MAVSGISGSSGATGVTGSRETIADNFDTFLQLLTTQLKHQNPLDPLDTNQFTQQLVQFTSVEQQLKTNDFLEAMVLQNRNSAAAQAVSYIGKQITASGVRSDIKDGEASWMFKLDAAAPESTITIRDASGNVVFTQQGALPQGIGEFTWDGVGNDGKRHASGTFSITIDARNANGGRVGATTEMTGKVTGADLSGEEPVLLVGNARITLSSVTSVLAGS